MLGLDIYTQIQNEITAFKTKPIKITDGYEFNQFENVKRIVLYDGGKFESGEYDSEGFKKFFKSVSLWRRIVATKMIDFDSKDILAIAENDESYWATFFFINELKFYMKTHHIGRLINEICWELPKFGSVVVKRSGKELNLVDLRNFRNDPSAKFLTDARYIIEEHSYSPFELYNKRDVWEKEAIDRVLQKYEYRDINLPEEDIKVFERHGVVKEGWLDKYSTTPNKLIKGYFIVAGCENISPPLDEKSKDESIGSYYENHIVLYKNTYENLPYEEGHWMRIIGRWQGVGIIEQLFDSQIRENELTNLKAKGLWWSAKKLFQTRDGIVARNLLTQVSDGEVIEVKSEITPISNEDRNLSSFAQEERRWDEHNTQSTFSHEAVRGETMPAGTPLGSVYIQQQMAAGFFDIKREDIGMFFKDVIMNQIIPIFKEEKRKKHIFVMMANSSDELNKFEEMVIGYRHANEVINFILKNRRVPTYDQFIMLKSMIANKIRNRKERYIELPDNFYDDLKYRLSLTITGEEINVQAKLSSLQVLLQMLQQNPKLFEDEYTKRVVSQMLNLSGIDPTPFRGDITEGIPGEELIGLAPVERPELSEVASEKIKTPAPLPPVEEGVSPGGSPPRIRIPMVMTPMAAEEKTI